MSNPNEIISYEKLKALEDNLKIAKKSDVSLEIFNILLNLIELCYEMKANELGLKYSQEAIDLDKRSSSCQNIHEFYKYMGDFSFELGLLDKAFNAYNHSIKKIPKSQFFNILADNYFKLGKISFLKGKFKQAIKHFKKSEGIYENQGSYAKQAETCNKIGLMYINKIPIRGDQWPLPESAIDGIRTFGRAKKYFKKAKMILEKNNLKDVEIELYNSIQTNLKSEFWHDYKL